MKLFSKFGNLRVWQKLTLVAVTLAMPVFLLAYLLLSNLTEQAGAIRAEMQGLEYVQAFRKLETGLATRDAAATAEAVKRVDELVAGKEQLLDATDAKWSSLKLGAKEMKAEEAAKLSILARELSGDVAAKANLVSDDTMIPRLQAELDRKLQAKDRGTSLALFAIAIGALLALWLVYRLANGISRQTQSIEETFARIGQGDYQARAAVVTSDELGQMAYSMNAVLDNTLALVQSRQERDQIQNAVMKLLEDVSGVADGDLTKEAEVTADMTGAIADSFNHMIAQLRRIIGNVQNTSRQVYRSANEVFSTAQGLATGSENQAMQIVTTSNAVDEMAGSIRQVSENAAVSAQVAQQALNNARQGNEAVKNTISGMDRIRNQVQETAKRIKRLGESTQEIGQIIQLIDDIADRTSILALNASIQAAAAGEAGRGFAVVAEEVERLADRSTDATKKIATLVKTIQSETNEAVGAMEKGILEVVEGSRLAASAGQALGEIESVSNKLADLISTISLASKQQARASEGVAKSMNEIEEITQATATGTKQAAGAVNSLAQLAESLRQSVAMFRMPGSHQTNDGTSMVIGKGTMAKIEFAAAVGPAKEAVATRF